MLLNPGRLVERFRRACRSRGSDTVAGRPLITFFGGKGGVGKTTCATAHALYRAGSGARVLLVSTDPAHSLGDLLQCRLGSRPRRIRGGFHALELDPERALQRYLVEVKDNLRELAAPELRDLATRQAELAGQAPGATDAALFDEMVRLVLDTGTQFDELVFDTAPTGHTLHLLALPEIMGSWSEGLLARRRAARESWPDRSGQLPPEDRAAEILERRRQRFAAMRERLLDTAVTRFVPVLNPDNLSREETRRMVRTLDAHGIRVDTLVINRILPETEDGGDFFRRRRAVENDHLAGIDRDFRRYRRVRIPLRAEEARGLEVLEQIGAGLAGRS